MISLTNPGVSTIIEATEGDSLYALQESGSGPAWFQIESSTL
jgi:hypothetical protein